MTTVYTKIMKSVFKNRIRNLFLVWDDKEDLKTKVSFVLLVNFSKTENGEGEGPSGLVSKW